MTPFRATVFFLSCRQLPFARSSSRGYYLHRPLVVRGLDDQETAVRCDGGQIRIANAHSLLSQLRKQTGGHAGPVCHRPEEHDGMRLAAVTARFEHLLDFLRLTG